MGLLAVHDLVDDLCKKAVGLCTRGKILGITAASRARGRPVTWKNTTSTLCINRKRKLSTHRAAIAHN
jgi:hypothetical protein